MARDGRGPLHSTVPATDRPAIDFEPDIHELEDTLACGILPEVVIDWARVVRED
jgi:hypothetical protein